MLCVFEHVRCEKAPLPWPSFSGEFISIRCDNFFNLNSLFKRKMNDGRRDSGSQVKPPSASDSLPPNRLETPASISRSKSTEGRFTILDEKKKESDDSNFDDDSSDMDVVSDHLCFNRSKIFRN